GLGSDCRAEAAPSARLRFETRGDPEAQSAQDTPEGQEAHGSQVLTDGTRMLEPGVFGDYRLTELVREPPLAVEAAQSHETNAARARSTLYIATGLFIVGVGTGIATNSQGVVIGSSLLFGLSAIPFFHFLGQSRDDLHEAMELANARAP